ncbi:hypothetical protein KC887_08535 [Candidatus Kaiserbacteria bacterium]|nr:hypothetical protein [Candidatus Kaiserbacteria bacterium]
MTSTSNSLDYSKLYTIREPWATRPFRLTYDDPWPNWTAEQSVRIAHGVETIPCPIQFRVYQGGQATDFLWTQSVWLTCVSQRTVDLLLKEKISGWSTYLVEVFDRKGDFLPGYHGFAVTGPTYDLDRSRSTLIDKPAPVPGGKGYQVYRGLYFDESHWDGSDMFWIDRAGEAVTERVYQLFKRHKISNVKFTPLNEDERRPEYPR